MGLFVAIPALPLVLITGYRVTPALAAFLVAACAGANVSRVVHLRF